MTSAWKLREGRTVEIPAMAVLRMTVSDLRHISVRYFGAWKDCVQAVVDPQNFQLWPTGVYYVRGVSVLPQSRTANIKRQFITYGHDWPIRAWRTAVAIVTRFTFSTNSYRRREITTGSCPNFPVNWSHCAFDENYSQGADKYSGLRLCWHLPVWTNRVWFSVWHDSPWSASSKI